MSKNAGLWIDHRQAIIVFVENKKLAKKLICSKVERQSGRVGGVRSTTPFESKLVVADDRQQSEFTAHLNTYYDEVVAAIREAESILIFGPGEAKGELIKRLERERLGGRIVAHETIDQMTEPQVTAKVRDYFIKRKVHESK